MQPGAATFAAHRDDPEGWAQVAIEHQGEMVGDLAVRVETSARRAALRYTVAPPAQLRGFATEAAAGMIDALFERAEIRRIVATADDANPASMRVIEPLGFCSEGIARKAAPVRGEWVDGVRFAILRDDRAAGIVADGVPVGFVLLAVATDTFPDPLRFLIDRWHQRRCIGGRVMAMLIEQLRDEGHQRLMTSWGVGPGSPEPFYRGIGFAPTGNMIDDEFEVALAL